MILNIPDSYQYLIDGEYFMENGKNLAPEIFRTRYINLFKMLQALIEKAGLGDYCTVSRKLLQIAVLDYFADIARLKEFHNLEHVQHDKIYAYEAFWLLRNHPIQVDNEDELDADTLHINEYIVSFLFIKLLATELEYKFKANIQIDKLIQKVESSQYVQDFRFKLFYSFRHRTFTAQTLLLNAESFMAAAQFTLQAT
ncbi:MAG: hypothetical protein FWF88_03170 [Peptococcaceae bacterium]|nr:hypothetical protein [Peptococcaceae bacterium]